MVTEECIRKEVSVPLNHVITANCLSCVFTDFSGSQYRFAGANAAGEGGIAKYRVINLGNGEIEDGSMASGYPVHIAIFKALCPTRAPWDATISPFR